MLRGEPLELVARETNVSIARLSEWRERALAGAATALKERERDDRDGVSCGSVTRQNGKALCNVTIDARSGAFSGPRHV